MVSAISGQENLSLLVNLHYLLALHQFLYPSSIVILPLSILFDSQQPSSTCCCGQGLQTFFRRFDSENRAFPLPPVLGSRSPGCVKARLVPEKP
jgi:hypothetical protein